MENVKAGCGITHFGDITCACDVTVAVGAPTPCAWCEDETGIRTWGSHGICESHAKAAIVRFRESCAAIQGASGDYDELEDGVMSVGDISAEEGYADNYPAFVFGPIARGE